MSPKVLVVGAGPAGTACAIELRRAGATVTVIDKARFPRDKCCGDGLTTGALRHLEALGFDLGTVPSATVTTGISLYTPGGTEIPVQLPGDGLFAVIAPRAELDHALVQLARANGAVVHEESPLLLIDSNGAAHVTATVGGIGTDNYDWVVAADGMWSPTRKMLGLASDGYLGDWHAFRQYLDGVTGSAAGRMHIWFEKDLLPGYAWSFPLPGGRVNFGYGILRGKGHSTKFMNALWDDLLSRPHIAGALSGAQPVGRHTAWPIPARIDTAVRSSGRVLFVGDAVCATDIMSGEGIGQALETGRLAAQSIIEGANAADVRARYSSLIDSHLLADHRMSVTLGRLLSNHRVAGAVLWLVNRNDWTRRNFARWMFEDEPRAVIFTPRRWHRGFLSRPGAYRGSGQK